MRALLFLSGIFLLFMTTARAQMPAMPGNPVNLQNAPQRDTTDRSAKKEWRDEPVSIHAAKAFSGMRIYPDTNIHHFHRRPYLQPWLRDLGNHGSPARSQLFQPENLGVTGPSLGYHVFDAYRPKVDSILYYNTTRPYTTFNYQLGSKLEQTLRVMHTQNISPRWNAAVSYQKITSQGFYRIQRNNHDVGTLSTHYQSKNQQYELYAAAVYGKFQTDENGGIRSDSLLDVPDYGDRATIPVALENENYTLFSSAGRRSSITNMFRDLSVQIRQQYTFGRRDTVFNADSTEYGVRLVPRFGLRHKLEAGSQRRVFKDLGPDSLIYAPFFNRSFGNNADSVFLIEQWTWVDNNFSLNGFFGPIGQQLGFQAGIGNRIDNFYTGNPPNRDRTSIISNYLSGSIQKEALKPGDWGYGARAKFFFSGAAVGNFLVDGELSKDFGKLGTVRVGGLQQLTDPPFAYTNYTTQYARQVANPGKESTTMLWAEVSNAPTGVRLGIRNYLIGNYIYLQDSAEQVSNGKLQLAQYNGAMNLTQLYLRYLLRVGHLVVDNDVAVQQLAGDGPISVPALIGRHTIAYESYIFRNALKVATGAEIRYHTAYNAEGYNPFYNRFYYQSAYTSRNKPELAIFFNFKVKRFRAYGQVEQLQTLLWRNTIVHPGYPSQNLMIRFGFDWVMVN